MGTTKYRAIYQQIKQDILTGTIEPGAKVVSERVLARMHGTGVITAARALSELARDGYVTREVGRGTFAARPDVSQPFAAGSADGGSRPIVLGLLLLGRQKEDPAYGMFVRDCVHIGTGSGCMTRCWELPENGDIPRGLCNEIAACDALIATGVGSEKIALELAWLGRPLVLAGIQSYSDELAAKTDCIITRYDEAARLGVEHLAGLGHRRIGLLNGSARVERSYAEFREGYRATLAWHHLPFDEALIRTCTVPVDLNQGFREAERLLAMSGRPTAIICVSDRLAYGVAHAVVKAGLSIPQDLSLIGGEDLPTSRTFIPPLTALHMAVDKVARHAVGLAVRRLRDPDGERHTVVLQPELVVRESTCRSEGDRAS